MDHDIIKEAVKRIRGLPTFSRIRDELRDKFTLEVYEKDLREDLENMVKENKLREKYTTIKGNRFKGYTVVEKKPKKKEKKKRTKEEEIIDEIFS